MYSVALLVWRLEWLAVETTENMAALNVDYNAWIRTVLGFTNSRLSFIFDLNSFYAS